MKHKLKSVVIFAIATFLTSISMAGRNCSNSVGVGIRADTAVKREAHSASKMRQVRQGLTKATK